VTVPIMKDLAANQHRKTHVQIRGNYLSLAEETTRRARRISSAARDARAIA
jgi:hypothetical protein